MLRMSGGIRTARSQRFKGERKGATIVIIAILTVVLFSFTAFAIDFGRAYLVNAQLQTSADAAALAGAFELQNRSYVTGYDSAVAMALRNKVQSVDPEILDVEPGFWNDSQGSFLPAAGWDEPGINAVRARTGHEMSYTFARVMGFANIDLAKPAIAAVGSASYAECMKPWGIPLQVLSYLAGRSNENDLSDLTQEEIDYLAENPRELYMKIPANPNDDGEVYVDGDQLPGNFQALALIGRGASNYQAAIEGDCSDPVEVDDRVESEPGNMVGPTWKGTSKWCLGYEVKSGVCPPEKAFVTIPIWDDPSKSGGRMTYRVRYIAGFTITRWEQGAVYGKFTVATHADAGGFDPRPGLLAVTALVR